MHIAILGAGAIAYGNAALLCRNGHSVVIWSPSGQRTSAFAAGKPLVATGAIEGRFNPRAANSCADALSQADAVVIAVPGYGHRHVLEAAAPHLRGEHVVVFNAHMSFAALYLAKLTDTLGVTPTIAALGSTVTTGRQTALDSVNVGAIRGQLDVAVIPKSAASRALEICQVMFGDRFALRSSLLEIALSNLSAQNHLAIALCNLTRMELGEIWKQSSHITPAVARFLEALDDERLAVAKAFGVSVRTIHDHYNLSYGIPMGPLAEMAQVLASRPGGVNGPTTLDTRYITEDVPFGLVPTIRLAALANVSVPLHEGGLRILSAIYGRDFEADNDVLSQIGQLSRKMLE